MIKISVIIPYYQKREGILRRALVSVLNQQLPRDIGMDIIVVDDGSPVPAKGESEGLNFAYPHQLITVEQANGGVGAARNTALHRMSPDTKYVAFLDSDDIWEPGHLVTAVAALEHGFDYYFCNSRREGSWENYFTLISFNPPLSPIGSPAIEGLQEVDKEWFYDLSLRQRPSLTPTIVYRRSVDAGIDFDDTLNLAGEDCLFFMQIIAKCKRVCYSSKILVACADGINIWHSRYGWDAPAHKVSHLCIVLSEQKMRKFLPLSEKNRQYLNFAITQRRRFFAYLTVRWALKKREIWPADLAKIAKSDPTFWLWYPLNVLYVAILYPLRLYTPLPE